MKCNNCGTLNSPQTLKCVNCNAPLKGSMVKEMPLQGKSGKTGQVVCKNCKSSNPATALKCHQCNAPLTGSMVLEDGLTHSGLGDSHVMCKNCQSHNPVDALRCHHCNAPLTGSLVIKNEAPAAKINKHTTFIKPTGTTSSGKICPHCQYPNQDIATQCVQCGHMLKTPVEAIKHGANPPKDDPATVPVLKSKPAASPKPPSKKDMKATVNPWMQAPESKTFTLTPLAADYTEKSEGVEYNQEEISLGRSQLDPDNNTISSAGQMKIAYIDGQWMMEDISQMQTCFIKVNGQQQLHDGDVLLLGNKLFKFQVK